MMKFVGLALVMWLVMSPMVFKGGEVDAAAKAGNCLPANSLVSIEGKECEVDADCEGTLKCCNNGKGTSCVSPI